MGGVVDSKIHLTAGELSILKALSRLSSYHPEQSFSVKKIEEEHNRINGQEKLTFNSILKWRGRLIKFGLIKDCEIGYRITDEGRRYL